MYNREAFWSENCPITCNIINNIRLWTRSVWLQKEFLSFYCRRDIYRYQLCYCCWACLFYFYSDVHDIDECPIRVFNHLFLLRTDHSDKISFVERGFPKCTRSIKCYCSTGPLCCIRWSDWTIEHPRSSPWQFDRCHGTYQWLFFNCSKLCIQNYCINIMINTWLLPNYGIFRY